jgi:hypothetical protein
MTERAVEVLTEADTNERLVAIIREHIEPLFAEDVFITVMVRGKDADEGDALVIISDDPEMDGVFGIETAPEGTLLN